MNFQNQLYNVFPSLRRTPFKKYYQTSNIKKYIYFVNVSNLTQNELQINNL